MAAGLGFKDFTTGEVLTAADVDGYLMQGVWVFASAAARDAAVTSPQEGNFAYLKDTNVTTYYTGSAWANLDTTGMTNPMTTTGDTIYSSSGSTPARLGIGTTGQVLTVSGGVPTWAAPAGGGGKVLQVVQDTQVGFLSTSGTTYITTGCAVSITPSATSSKILVLLTLNGVSKANDSSGSFVLRRSGTDISLFGDNIPYSPSFSGENNIGTLGVVYLDSPSTTSSRTYEAFYKSNTSGKSIYINNYNASDTVMSSIVVMEIGA